MLSPLHPPFCTSCNRPGTYLCGQCQSSISWRITPSYKPRYTSFTNATYWAAAEYKAPLTKLIHHWKFSSVRSISQDLAQLCYHHSVFPQADCISYIPLHPKKKALRGFDQCQDLATHLAALLKLPMLSTLSRKYHTNSQSKSQRLQRTINPVLFKQSNNLDTLPARLTQDKSLLLIDDVLTTGTTANRALIPLHTKFRHIFVWSLVKKG